jgi:hypothetical protein
MKYIATVLFCWIYNLSTAQQIPKVDSIIFCNKKYAVPKGCIARPDYLVKCDDYAVTWLYPAKDTIQLMPNQIMTMLASKMEEFKKDSIICYLQGKNATGYKMSYKTDTGLVYQIISYGFIDEQPVMVWLILNRDIKTNEDLPKFVRQLMTIGKKDN